MKGFTRKNQLLSLCGLNCGLCPLFLGKYCGGCGVDNQPCAIAKCSLDNGKVEYCYECENFPCQKYQNIDAHDSFITHRRQKSDLEKAQKIGVDAYNSEQKEKRQILHELLENYDDGRRKSFFCLAVNLLELPEIREIMKELSTEDGSQLRSIKERASSAAEKFQKLAAEKNISLKLNKKK